MREEEKQAVEQFLKTLPQDKAQIFMNELMKTSELMQDIESPVVQHIYKKIENRMKQHGEMVLSTVKPQEEWTYKCSCGAGIDMNKMYYQAFRYVWETINMIHKDWIEKNRKIAEKGNRRTK